MLVKQVLGHPVGRGAHATQVADVVAQLLDGLHLFVQVVGLQEVVHLKTGRWTVSKEAAEQIRNQEVKL